MKVFQRRWEGADGKARKAWCVDYRDPISGKRVRRALKGVESRKQANETAGLLFGELNRRAILGADAGPGLEEQAMTFGDLVDAHLRRVGVADGTRRLEEQKAATLVRILGRKTSVTALSARDVERYKSTRLGEGATPASINRELAIVRAALNRAHDDGRLSRVPCRIRKLTETEPERRFLTQDEAERLIAALADDQETQEVAIFALATALRPAELWRMTWSDVDWTREALAVETRKAGGSGTVRRDVVPLNTAAIAVLTARASRLDGSPPADGLVFGVPPSRRRAPRNGMKRRGGPGSQGGYTYLGQYRVNDRLKAGAQRAGISNPQDVTLYTLRHTSATLCYNASKSVVQTQKLLRHRSPMLTLSTYTHASEHEVRSTLNQVAIGLPARIIPIEPADEATG